MSVRYRLLALFFLITTAAVVFVYLYVVPQLDSQLTAEQLRRLESSEGTQRIAGAMRSGVAQSELRRVIRSVAQQTDARVTVLGVREGASGPVPEFVIGDSAFERTATQPRYPGAAAAASSGQVTSAVERVDGARLGQAATPGFVDGEASWVTVLSVDLSDVDDNVALIKRQILIAGAIAILAALAAGWFAAGAHTRRLRRLEAAAEAVADGDFRTQIPVDSTDEVGQLARSFNEMQKRLARLDSARKEFIANASHELRTPIFSLGGFVELLEEEDPDPEARAEFVRTMREQITRLKKLTADLLDLSKLDADAIQLRSDRVNAGRLAERVVAEFAPALETHSSTATVDRATDAIVDADADRLAQILRILIDNALTHTPKGTAISITSKQDGGTAMVTVRDDGPGIEAHDRDRVFERFYTGDELGGSGLGLAIARELAVRMGGDLEVASHRGRTEFTVRLPAVRAEVQA
ncbi:MAG: sensor histidine kinase [Solirubrobacterales bacterium]